MGTQRVYQLLAAFAVITIIAFVSERSHVLASIVTVIPIRMTFAIWVIFTSSGGNAAIGADYARMTLFGLIPLALFMLTCWLGFRQGWLLKRVMVVSYAVWFTATVFYRLVERWASGGQRW